MKATHSLLVILKFVTWIGLRQVCAFPLNNATALALDDDDQSHAEDYANMKYDLINNLGYSEEFAEMVEINLKRAVREEKERQRQESLSSSTKPDLQRQGMQGSEEYDDEESTVPAITTPGPSPGDVVRGVAGIITSVGTFNLGSFWNSFVNFFPPNQREGAQAVVDSSLGRRPGRWPTLPTTTTKLTTSTVDPDDIDSAETTKSAVTAAPAGVTATTAAPAAASGTATLAPVAGAAVAPVTESGTRSPTTKYMVRRGTVLPDVVTTGLELFEIANAKINAPSKTDMDEDDEIELLSAYSSNSTTTGSTS